MKLLLTGAFNYCEEQLDGLKSQGYEILFVQDERIPLKVDVSDVDAVVCNALFLFNDIKKFKNLKIIQLTSAGLDRVPLDYIKENRISLFNAKGVYSIPMAEWVVLKILEIYKKSRVFYEAQREHQWNKQRELLELTGRTASIIGYGDVGKEIAKRLKGFDVKVIGVGRRSLECQFIDDFYLVDELENVLKMSDIVILTLPLTHQTNNLIDSDKLVMMKNNSILVNVSRGGIIEEDSLIETLKEGKFLGVALDVFEEEPLKEDSRLWNCNRVIITPHNSFVSNKTSKRLFETILKNLVDFKINLTEK
ncbi:NAD(P)-dependent oxidoreductase [Rossellomorea aquimaris]|nr:NAD(P)-dependent oxidoreductase [Rossellomorea aquimaris]